MKVAYPDRLQAFVQKLIGRKRTASESAHVPMPLESIEVRGEVSLSLIVSSSISAAYLIA
jgi:hypothetical protein